MNKETNDLYYALSQAVSDEKILVIDENGTEKSVEYWELLNNGATIVIGERAYVYRNRYEQGPLDGWWDDIKDGNLLNVCMFLRVLQVSGGVVRVAYDPQRARWEARQRANGC
jgi:hypothetical protein